MTLVQLSGAGEPGGGSSGASWSDRSRRRGDILGRVRSTSRQGASRLDIAAVSLLVIVTVVAVLVPWLAPHDPKLPIGTAFQAPGHGGLLGTDEVGRDVLTRLLFGLRASWLAAIVVIAAGLIIGGIVGVVAGATGGIVDSVLMRITDGFLSLPAAILAIALVAALGPSFAHVLEAIVVVWWPYYARLFRTEIRALAARPHLEAARLAGASRWRLATRHLLPGAMSTVLVAASLDVGAVILTLASLSYLGLGAPAPAPELGAMSSQGLTYLLAYWWIPILPALTVFALCVVANLAGDGVRDLFESR
ncbi:MAG: ABC-type dipeptide/oligopeptide/nickel transport system, permease component [Acidimicrobiales bacterium]|nr:ABC-type dipeptide/oligopeptide/nickel transport system, permease component [Acidimicrobiales bacterium]